MFLKRVMVIWLSLMTFASFAASRADIAWQKIDQGALLVDVRTPQEFDAQHLNNSVNFPLNTVNVSFNDIAKDREIVLYCRSGNRSGQAERYLKQVGFTNVHNGGGIQELLQVK